MKIYRKPDLHTKQLVMVTTGSSPLIEPHSHDYFELVYVLDGQSEQIVDGKPSVIGRGNYYLIDIGQSHEYRRISEKNLPIINVLFSPRLIDAGARPADKIKTVMRHRLIGFEPDILSRSPAGIVFEDENGEIHGKFTRMLESYRGMKQGYREYIRAELLSVLILMLQSVSKPLSKQHQKEFVRWLADYAECNYAQPISLSDLCHSISYSLPYVSKCFRAGVGMTFSEYLQKVRITQSCAMLCESNMPVEEICRLVGYSNTAFFHRIFRNTVGLTPLEYRKLNRR